MSLATIDNGGSSQQDFDKYFASTDLFELFQFDANETNCVTMELLLKEMVSQWYSHLQMIATLHS